MDQGLATGINLGLTTMDQGAVTGTEAAPEGKADLVLVLESALFALSGKYRIWHEPIENSDYNFDCLRLSNNSIMYFPRKDSMNQSDQNNWKVTIIAIFFNFFCNCYNDDNR